MKRLSCFLMFLFIQVLQGQQLVKGYLVAPLGEPFPNCKLSIKDLSSETISDENGFFSLQFSTSFTEVDLIIETPEGLQQIVPLPIESKPMVDLGYWKVTISQEFIDPQTTVDWDALFEEDQGFDRGQIGSILNSQRDVFLNTVAFQFSPTFYRMRGLDPSYQEVRLNGVPVQSFFKGSPQWSQWGGLNDFTNSGQQFFEGASSKFFGRGGFLSTTTIDFRPSALRSGTKISQAFSNSSYRYRTQFSMVQSPNKKALGYGLLFSRRWGEQGYLEGTPYEAFSGALLLEKNWTNQHQSWFTFLFTPSSRGKNAPLTKEVFDLKGRQYNPYWGIQSGRIRNSRITETKTPIVLLNHLWELSKNHRIQFNFGFVWGTHQNSRLAYNGHQLVQGVLQGGGRNPDPVYYQYLPSYPLRNSNEPDYVGAFQLQEELKNNGQIDWEMLYEANQTESGYGIYSLNFDTQKLNQKYLTLQHNARASNGINYRTELGIAQENAIFYASPRDLLGAQFLWDYNSYASNPLQIPNHLLFPDRKVEKGAPFQYHYGIQTTSLNVSLGFDYHSKGLEVYGGVSGDYRSYWREGYFQNGNYPEHSYGKGSPQIFKTSSLKGGINYAFTGRHYLSLQAQWFQSPPAYKNVYINPRENEFTIPESTFETDKQLVISYLWQGQSLELKAKGYTIQRNNIQEVSSYFADGIGGDSALFVQEITQGVDFFHLGIDGSFDWEILPEFRLSGVLSLGEYRYANNPKVYLGTVPSDDAVQLDFQNGIKSLGNAFLKNYALAGGPQQAYSLSLHYEDPNYWRLSIYANYFSNSFLDPNPLLRTSNFFSDTDGLPFSTYDPDEVQTLLAQEQFPIYYLLNMTTGKSWRIGNQFGGFFCSIQNILNTVFLSSGFEQGRNANYPSLKLDQERSRPLFNPKYWWGRGTTYFISTYYRF